MSKCMYCGAEIEEGIAQCPFCNAALPIEAAFESPYSAGQAQPAASASYQPPSGQQYQQPYQPPQQQPYQQPYGNQQPQPAFTQPYTPQAAPVQDSGSIGWGVLGFFIPIVGWILYFVWRNTKPKSANMAGIGGLIGFGLNLVLSFGMGVLG